MAPMASAVFIVNFEHISHLVLVFLLLTLNRWMTNGAGTFTCKNGAKFETLLVTIKTLSERWELNLRQNSFTITCIT